MRLHLLMLAGGPAGGAGIDMATGTLLRLYFFNPVAEPVGVYDVLEAESVADDDVSFTADSVAVRPIRRVGRVTGRRAERLLRPLVHPSNEPLFGTATATVPYWELRPERPSLSLVVPHGHVTIERQIGIDASTNLRCRFRWRRLEHVLPLDDPGLTRALSHPAAVTLTGRTLARALGWRPHRLLVALTPPREGRCHKVAAALLPKP